MHCLSVPHKFAANRRPARYEQVGHCIEYSGPIGTSSGRDKGPIAYYSTLLHSTSLYHTGTPRVPIPSGGREIESDRTCTLHANGKPSSSCTVFGSNVVSRHLREKHVKSRSWQFGQVTRIAFWSVKYCLKRNAETLDLTMLSTSVCLATLEYAGKYLARVSHYGPTMTGVQGTSPQVFGKPERSAPTNRRQPVLAPVLCGILLSSKLPFELAGSPTACWLEPIRVRICT